MGQTHCGTSDKCLRALGVTATLARFQSSSNRLRPTDRLAVYGGSVRIRPIVVVRVASVLLGVALCLPVSQANAAQRRTHHTVSHKKTAYSASASNARRVKLARARASARAREQARLRELQEAMTPRF